ncbi:MAG: NAD-dependent deacylase [Candidatus Syntrophoarchaeum sp. WYZ-LMO15]|nr:MAG: NAD-dependent deacylase [Candidatus Syntrophoarchaeum sp. WYZ-LMO15]
MPGYDDLIEDVASSILSSKHTVALTGAGISVESGIAPFRGKGGLWERYDPEEYAHIATFMQNPARAWVLFKEMIEVIRRAKPNPAHLALARLEELGLLSCIITQNVDNLHQSAGSRNVIEFHGNIINLSCIECGKKQRCSEVSLDEIPPLCACGGVLRPDAVLFGEAIPFDALVSSRKEAEACDLMLVIGTSGIVQPAASMPLVAKDSGAKVVEINPEETPITFIADIFVKGGAGRVLSDIIRRVEDKLR